MMEKKEQRIKFDEKRKNYEFAKFTKDIITL